MKKHLILAAACLASAGAAYGQGQGAIIFQNYNGGSLISPVTYNANPAQVPAGKAGLAVGNTFKAELGYFIGTTTLASDITLIPASIGTFFGSADGGIGANGGAGFFQLGSVNLPNVTSPALASAITFEVFVWQATGALGQATYAAALANGVSGHSTIFTMGVGGTGAPPAGVGDFGTHLQPFTVSQVTPEPGTLALAGLGAAGLLLFRRRK